jgi:hypothetical protein
VLTNHSLPEFLLRGVHVAREYAWQPWMACGYMTHRAHDIDNQPAAAKRAARTRLPANNKKKRACSY